MLLVTYTRRVEGILLDVAALQSYGFIKLGFELDLILGFAPFSTFGPLRIFSIAILTIVTLVAVIAISVIAILGASTAASVAVDFARGTATGTGAKTKECSIARMDDSSSVFELIVENGKG